MGTQNNHLTMYALVELEIIQIYTFVRVLCYRWCESDELFVIS